MILCSYRRLVLRWTGFRIAGWLGPSFQRSLGLERMIQMILNQIMRIQLLIWKTIIEKEDACSLKVLIPQM